MTCPDCQRTVEAYPCNCGYRPPHSQEDDRLRMKSGNRIPQCTWVTVDRCCLPASGQHPGQPLRCQWHLHWGALIDQSRSIEERIERPAFDAWWDWRVEAYKTQTSWGLSKEEYWRYAHGHRVHDPKPETLPAIQEAPGHLSRDEFGQDLFAAIKTQAGITRALKSADLYASKDLPKQAQACTEQALRLSHELQTIMNKETIHPDDLRRLLAIHE